MPETTVRRRRRRAARDEAANVVRVVEGVSSRMPMRMDLPSDSTTARVTRTVDGLSAVVGPDALRLRTPTEIHGEGLRTMARRSTLLLGTNTNSDARAAEGVGFEPTGPEDRALRFSRPGWLDPKSAA